MSTIIHTASGVVGSVGSQIHQTTTRVGTHMQTTANRWVPPEQRQQFIERLQAFASQNPKLAAFLAVQLLLTGIPLVLFLAFATSTLLFSLLTCILLGVLAAVTFTFIAVGIALLVVVPTVFVASCSATFIFIWGFTGYLILRRLNQGEPPLQRGTPVGDRIQRLTGGRVDAWVGDGNDRTSNQTGPRRNTRSERDHINHSDAGPGAGDWERKWSSGTNQGPQNGIGESNPFEILKPEMRIS